MAGKDVTQASAAITANGTAAGYITVASNTPFYVGAKVFVTKDDDTVKRPMIITEIGAAGLIGLKKAPAETTFAGTTYLTGTVTIPAKTPAPNYGRDDCSEFVAVGGWKIFQASQFIYNAT